MNKFLSLAVAVALSLNLAAMADELKVNVSVENGTKATEVVGADIYANIDGKLTEITVAPDDMAFKMNLKTGALRIKSFWLSNAKTKKVTNSNITK